MTGIEIFLGGGILMCNMALVAYLMSSNKKTSSTSSTNSQSVSDSDAEQGDHPQKNETSKAEQQNLVAPSKFNADEFMAQIAAGFLADVKKELPHLIKAALGDVKGEDVEFGDDNSQNMQDEFIPAKNYRPLSSKEAEIAFDTDIKDVEQQPPSAPSDTGSTIDELEDAVNTAMDKNSTEEELANAGRIIEPYKVTEFYDMITFDDEINRRVDLCCRLAIKAQVELKVNNPDASKSDKSVDQPKAEEVKPKKSRRALSVNLDDVDLENFNPADLLRH